MLIFVVINVNSPSSTFKEVFSPQDSWLWYLPHEPALAAVGKAGISSFTAAAKSSVLPSSLSSPCVERLGFVLAIPRASSKTQRPTRVVPLKPGLK